MSPTKRQKRRRSSPGFIKIEHNGSPAGLARTKKRINAQRDLEIQFMKICYQIHLDDLKQVRADRQRDERIAKRQSA